MKKTILISCILIISLLFIACGDIITQNTPYVHECRVFQWESYWLPSPRDCPNIDPELAVRIRMAYWEFTGGDVDAFPIWVANEYWTTDVVYVAQYYGNFSGMEIVWIESRGGFQDVMRWVDIAGYIFEFGSSQELYAFKCGNFYTILQAYEKGLMIRADIGVIWHLRHGE